MAVLFTKPVKAFLEDESGATAIEYGILVGLIGAGIIAAAGGVATKLQGLLGEMQTALEAVEVPDTGGSS